MKTPTFSSTRKTIRVSNQPAWRFFSRKITSLILLYAIVFHSLIVAVPHVQPPRRATQTNTSDKPIKAAETVTLESSEAGAIDTTVSAFNPKRFTRTKGAPNHYVETFTMPGECSGGNYKIAIKNGEQDGTYRISSAEIVLNGQTIFVESDFSQNIYQLEKPVTLASQNILEIKLASPPNSYLTIDVSGENCGPTDTIPPHLVITSPEDNKATTDPTSIITGTAEDLGDGASGIAQVLVNNAAVSYDPTTKIWVINSFPLNIGTNVVTARAIDYAGNESTSQITIIRDLTPPTISISSPADGAVTLETTAAVAGVASDGGADASGIARVTVNGTDATLDLISGNWNLADLSLAVGTNTVATTATDRAGNQTSSQITVTRVVNQAPVVNAGPDKAIELPDSAVLSGSASDDGYPVGSTLSLSWSKVSGDGDVVFSAPGAAETAAAFSSPGTYVLRLSASDGLLSGADETTITVYPVNQPPSVNAGNDQTIELPNTANLSGAATDDGFPTGSSLSFAWSKISGDGNVIFASSGSMATTAQFETPGIYILRLTATDGPLSTSDDIQVTVNPENHSPVVNAGNDQTINLPFSASLQGMASDDGNPIGSSLSTTWSKVSGDGQVTFSNPGALSTLASFSSPGTYVLRISASDGRLSAIDEMTVTVKPSNRSPAVDAGPDQTIRLQDAAALIGTVNDDGLPQGSSVIVAWSKISGPGGVSFSNSGSLSTAANFGQPGEYVLRLNATDGELVSTDDVTVSVGAGNQAPVVSAGEDKIAALANGSFQFVQNNLSQFDQIASAPGIAVDFDGIPAGTNITGNSYNGMRFEAGNLPSPSAPLIVVKGTDTFTSVPGYSGVINAATNKLFPSSGENVLSPGGAELAPGPNNLKENDDLKITFDEPVAAVGFDILFQEDDFFSAVGITILDAQGAVLYQNPTLPVSSTSGGGAPGGKEFFGFVSRRSNIKTILIDESDNNSQFPDANIGFDTFRVQKVLPNTSTTLNGSVSDDGLPAGGTLTSVWSKVSGTGTVTFADASSPTTAVAFSQPGTYVLRLTGDDSALTSFDDVVINAFADGQQPANQTPQVNAGSDQTITLNNPAHLFGIVTDDGLPAGSRLSVTWNIVSGPGTVTFSSPNTTASDAVFGQTGTYVLRLTATDSLLSASDDLTVMVLDAAAINQPPTADSGGNRSVALNSNLVSNPSGELSLVNSEVLGWTTVSGSWSASEGETASVPQARFGNHVIAAGNSVQGDLRQDVDLRAYAEAINAGTQAFEWKAYVRSQPEAVPDAGSIILEYRDASNQNTLGTLTSGDIASTTEWHLTDDIRVPPAGTGFLRIRLLATRNTGNTTDVFFDGFSLRAIGGVAAIRLNGVATDDGLPSGSILQTDWTRISGNSTVAFGDSHAAETSARFDTAGTYVLRLAAADGALSASDDIAVTVLAANQAPSANAGTDQTVALPSAVSLSGSSSDDGAELRYRWAKVSGPGMVSFSDPKILSPTATLSIAGTYVLRLTVEDGEYETSDDVKITATPAPFNQPPTVEAGNTQTIQLPANSVSLAGAVTDDGLPNNSLTAVWSKTAGSGTVVFSNPTSAATSVTFDSAGSYVLRLTVSDGQFTVWDELAIVVNPVDGGGGQNQPPVVQIGPDQTTGISQPAILEALSIVDDGLPVGGSYSSQWSKVSGPGNVSFSNPTHTATYANFSQVGSYVLRLTVSDSELSGSDDITVTVVPDQPTPTIEILSPQDGASITAPTTFAGNISDGTWKLEYSLADTDDLTQRIWTEMASGAGPTNGTLGSLDTTLLLNGLYDVRLTASNQSGQTASQIVSISVERNLKIGNFTVSFDDMNVPVAGIPIQVIRTYDSRDTRKGDFGIGWTLGIKNVRVEKNNILGLRWFQTRSDTFIPTYCVEALRPHLVTVTMPDGKVNRFEARLDRQCQQAGPITQAHLIFTPQAGTQGTLSVDGDNTLFVAGSVPGPVDLIAADSSGIFDNTVFKYTSKEGTEFRLAQGSGLQSLKDTNGNTVTVSANGITHSSGKSISFTRDTLGRITQITDPDGVSNVYTYDESGDLTAYKDRENNTTAFTYEPTIPHHLRSIVDPLNRTPIRNEYDASGRLLKHVDANGEEIVYTHDLAASAEIVRDRLNNETRYEYDSHGNVLKKRDALGNETTYSYDANDNVLTETNALGKTTTSTYDLFDNRTSVTDPLNHRTEFTYNSQGKVLTVKDARNHLTTNTYDNAGNLLTTQDALENTTVNTFSAQDGSLLSIKDALNNLTHFDYFNGFLKKETDALGTETNFSYDANGNRSLQTVQRTNAQGQVETIATSFEYDNLNRLTKTTFADGSFTQTEYNELGQQKATIDQAGSRTEFEYDTLGRLTKTTYADGKFEESTYDAEGRRLTSKDRAGHITTYEYDALGRPKKTTYADGTFTTTNYDAIGQVLNSTDARGNPTAYTYDDAGRRLTVKNALNQITELTYDANGNQLTLKDALDHTTGYVYDDLNRRTRTNFADSTFTETTFDELGRRIAEKDQAGKVTQFVYDPLGRLTKVKDALNQETGYAYNEVGQQTKQIDALNRETRYEYDQLGRRTKRILPLGQTETYTYGSSGNLDSKTDFNGKTTTFAYDNMRRLLSKTPDTSLNQPSVSFTYNDLGQRATMTDASGVTNYVYDVRNRLESKQTPFGTLGYTYDDAGNIETLRSSNTNGVSVDYSYDELNRLHTVKDNRLAGSQDTSYTYDAAGNLQSYTYPNQVISSYAYNTVNRLTTMTVSNGATNQSSYAYTLGAAGNRTQVVEQGGRTVDYVYDDLYRLTNETIANSANNGSIAYQYDPVGNRLERSSTVSAVPNQNSTYDPNDRLNSDTYDANGNTKASNGKTYNYDFENKLTATSDGVTIVYDGDGNRVAKIAAGVTTNYLVDTNNLTGYAQVVEELHNGQVTKQYTYGHDLISQRCSQLTANCSVSFYSYDGHGSVRQLTDATASVTDTYSYDAFGTLIERTGSTDNNYLYAGEQFDPDLGLYYNRARYLNVATGRFISLDIYEGSLFDPAALHKYLYADNNPTNRVDPSGRFGVAEVSIANAIRSILSEITTYLGNALQDQILYGGDAGLKSLAIAGVLGAAGVFLASVKIGARARGLGSRASGYIPLGYSSEKTIAGGLTNSRGRYQAALSEAGLPRLPDDWDVHHSIPQELRGDPKLNGIDIDAPENLRGIRGSASPGVETNHHQYLTNRWKTFLSNNGDWTLSRLLEFRDQLDWEWQHVFWEVKQRGF